MITAYLVGDQQLLERLCTLPEAINSGLVRGITRLGIGLQRTLRQDNISGRVPTRRTQQMPLGMTVWRERSMSEPAFGVSERPSPALGLER